MAIINDINYRITHGRGKVYKKSDVMHFDCGTGAYALDPENNRWYQPGYSRTVKKHMSPGVCAVINRFVAEFPKEQIQVY